MRPPTRIIVTSILTVVSLINLIAPAQTAPPALEAKPIDADSTITAVTLYRGRAAVTRSTTVPLEPGVYDVKIANLPESIQPQTIQARAHGAVKVLNVDYAQETTADPAKQFAELDAQIETLTRQIKEIGEQRELIKIQEQFIDSVSAKAAAEGNKTTGTDKFDLDAMRQQLAFIGEERTKLLAARRELDAQERESTRQLQVVQNKRQSLGSGQSNISRTATVSIVATESGDARIDLTYLVANATWEPSYNVRAVLGGSSAPESIGNPNGTTSGAQIEYDAILTQRTGEDWDDVKLTLSTAQPTVAANPPALRAWFVDVFKPEVAGRVARSVDADARYGFPQSPPPPAPAGRAPGAAEEDRKALERLGQDASVAGEGPSVSFELPRAVTVKTNIQKQQRTRIAVIESKAKFIHVAVPALTDAVYIRGDLTNSSAYQILPGRASIFVGQDYIGPTTLAAVAPNVDFKLHFGIDQSVKASRQMVTKKTENTGLLSGGRRTSHEYRLLIDNGTGKSITMELWDRYPISRSSEIQIETVDISHPLATDAKYVAEEKPQGLLKWMLSVPANAKGNNAAAVKYGVHINRAKDVEMTPLPE